MKKGQNVNYKKEVFQTGLTERCIGSEALRSFLTSQQSKRDRHNVIRKKKKK